MLQCLTIVVTAILPKLCLTIVHFRARVLPSTLVLSFTRTERKIPFSDIIRLVFLRLTFRLVQRTKIEIPKSLKGTVNVINKLIVKRTTMRTGLIDPVIIVVITLATLNSVAIPGRRFTTTFQLIGCKFLVLKNCLKVCKVILKMCLIVKRLTNLVDFNVPCLIPFVGGRRGNDEKRKVLEIPLHGEMLQPLCTERRRGVHLGEGRSNS